MSGMNSDLLESIDRLSIEQIDALPLGVVGFDRSGRIEVYNTWEATMAGIPRTSALGKNLFAEIAPCTDNERFAGRFREALAQETMDIEFDYVFTYKMRPTPVHIRLYRRAPGAMNWLFVSRR